MAKRHVKDWEADLISLNEISHEARNLRKKVRTIKGGKLRLNRSSLRKSAPGKKTATKHKTLAVAGVLLILGCFVHLWDLSYPNQVVFDEVHFAKHVTSYCCSGENIFSLHPPHTKLLMALAAKVTGYKGNFTFEKIGQDYGEVSSFALRWLPALMGALLPVIIFFLLRLLGGSRPIALLGGLAILFESAMMVHSRIVAMDSFLLAFTFGAFCLFLIALKTSTKRKYLWMLGAGALAGLAVGSKFTGLTIWALFLVILFRPFISKRNKKTFLFGLKRLGILLSSALTVYILGWYIHFSLLPNPGPGDRFYRLKGEFIQDTITLHEKMWTYNVGLKKQHPGASSWWEWPLMKKPIYFWAGKDHRAIYMVGNPVVWLGTGFFFLVIIGISLLGRVTTLNVIPSQASHTGVLWVPITGFLISYIPFMLITRPLFMYHYFMPLIFSLLVVLLWLDQAEWISSSKFKKQRKSYYAVIAAIVLGFLTVSPMVYGYRATDFWHSIAMSIVRAFG